MLMKCRKQLHLCAVTSPLGKIFMEACADGIHRLSFDKTFNEGSFSPDTKCEVKLVDIKSEIPLPLQDAVEWLKIYFSNPSELSQTELPQICTLNNETFSSRVWKVLTQVPLGQSVSYKELAELSGSSGAARAVGTAMKNNPVAIMVPCHRVTRSSDLGRYSGGQGQCVKEWLLLHEGWTNKFK